MTGDDRQVVDRAIGGRPQGEVRLALADAARVLAAQHGAANWRQIAAQAQVGYAVAKRTVHVMARAGDLQPVGTEPVPHARRPMTRFAPGTRAVDTAGAQQRLADVMQGWRGR